MGLCAVTLFHIFKTLDQCNPERLKSSFQGGPRTTESLVIWKVFTKQVKLEKQGWNPPLRWQAKEFKRCLGMRSEIELWDISLFAFSTFSEFFWAFLWIPYFLSLLCFPRIVDFLSAEVIGWDCFFPPEPFKKAFLVKWMDQCWIAQGYFLFKEQISLSHFCY